MSDGNYNKNLLPYHNYQSGVRAGRAAMKTLAVRAFLNWLEAECPDKSESERMKAVWEFKSFLP